ncbi:hypothetical protein DFJ73DRAFT_796315 [Zopfochytrium polystomum]|nr:hypothetical protein DFJ73DRAFT_796315 [Zopfochytrium polystomum]
MMSHTVVSQLHLLRPSPLAYFGLSANCLFASTPIIDASSAGPRSSADTFPGKASLRESVGSRPLGAVLNEREVTTAGFSVTGARIWWGGGGEARARYALPVEQFSKTCKRAMSSSGGSNRHLLSLPDFVLSAVGGYLDGRSIWASASSCRRLRHTFLLDSHTATAVWIHGAFSRLSSQRPYLPRSFLRDLAPHELIDLARRYTAPTATGTSTGGGVRPFAPPEPLLLVPFGVTALPPQEARPTEDESEDDDGRGSAAPRWVCTRRVLHVENVEILDDRSLSTVCYFRRCVGRMLFRPGADGGRVRTFFFDMWTGRMEPVTAAAGLDPTMARLCQVHGTDLLASFEQVPAGSLGPCRLFRWDDQRRDLVSVASPTGREPFSLRAERALQVLWEGSTRFKYIYFDTKAATGCIVARNGWGESDAAVVFAANEAGDDLDVQPIASASTLQLCNAVITPRSPIDRIVHMPSQSIALLEKGINAPFSVDLYNWDDLASAEKEGPPQPQRMTLDFGRDINIASVSPMQMDATRLFCWSRWRTPSTASTHRRPVDNAFHQLRSVALVDAVRRRVHSAPLPCGREDFDFFVVVEDAWAKAGGEGADVRREMRCYLMKAPESGAVYDLGSQLQGRQAEFELEITFALLVLAVAVAFVLAVAYSPTGFGGPVNQERPAAKSQPRPQPKAKLASIPEHAALPDKKPQGAKPAGGGVGAGSSGSKSSGKSSGWSAVGKAFSSPLSFQAGTTSRPSASRPSAGGRGKAGGRR